MDKIKNFTLLPRKWGHSEVLEGSNGETTQENTTV
jgi:hypothetical protein